jgi:hypothetical protein
MPLTSVTPGSFAAPSKPEKREETALAVVEVGDLIANAYQLAARAMAHAGSNDRVAHLLGVALLNLARASEAYETRADTGTE